MLLLFPMISSILKFNDSLSSSSETTHPTLIAKIDQTWSKLAFTRLAKPADFHVASKKLAQELVSKYTHFVLIGIGGSSMGARCISEITGKTNIHFLDNVDSAEFTTIWNQVKPHLEKTAFICISKSGSTMEILWNYSQLENLAKTQGCDIIQQSYFVSELTTNPLSNFARKHNRPLLEVPVDIGGRFSVLSPVGLLIAGICGLDTTEMQQGAAVALEDKLKVAAICGSFLDSFKRNENITLFWFYNSSFRWFGSWLQQLWAESLGKQTDRNGNPAPAFSTPMIAIGSCDQHSILQQVAHGPKDKFVCFFSFRSVETSQLTVQNVLFDEIKFMQGRNYGELIACQSKATHEALRQNKVSSEFFSIDDSNKSKSLGYLFMFFQLVVATLGEHENINAFDQPGVTLGKEITLRMLKNN